MINLTKEQLDALHAAGDQIVLIDEEINRAERAGLDVKELRAQLQNAEIARQKLLQVYGGITVRRRVVS